MILEGERVLVRNWLDSDVGHYMALANDVGYNCFSQPGHFLVRTTEEAKRKIEVRMDLFRERSLGKFPVFLKGTDEFIGTCGLEPIEVEGRHEIELGYRLCLKHWGKGYATESAATVLRYGFGDLRLEKILGFALPQNGASLRILEKLGGRYLRDFVHNELAHRLYEMPRDRFAT